MNKPDQFTYQSGGAASDKVLDALYDTYELLRNEPRFTQRRGRLVLGAARFCTEAEYLDEPNTRYVRFAAKWRQLLALPGRDHATKLLDVSVAHIYPSNDTVEVGEVHSPYRIFRWGEGGLTYLKTSVHLDIDRDRDYERLYGTRPAEVLSEEREARERGDDLVLADLEADLIDSLYKGDGLWQPVREA